VWCCAEMKIINCIREDAFTRRAVSCATVTSLGNRGALGVEEKIIF